jgi:hypothetical protein
LDKGSLPCGKVILYLEFLYHHRRCVMGNGIAWETSMEAALPRAKTEKKPVLLDFFNPG